MAISTTSQKLQQTSDEIGGQPTIASIPFVYIEGVKVKLRGIQVFQNYLGNSNSFILGHPTNGQLGVANGLGGGQIVLGDSGGSVQITVLKRSYDWKDISDFQRGTKTDNVDISQGFLQLGNITVKNILLEHKTK